MINSKKLLSIVCVFAIVVSMFSAMTVSAATVPAANLDITYNKSESTTSQLVFDMTTSAEYLNTASIVIDISPVWDMVSGSTYRNKGTTINSASSMGTAVASNVSEYSSTAKFACLSSKKVKLQLTAAGSDIPFDFTGSNVVAKLVIPLTAELTEDVTFTIDATATFLTPAVYDETSDSGYTAEEQYLSAEKMTINATSWTISVAKKDPVTVTGGTAAVTGDKDDTKVWAVAVAGDQVAAGDVLTATLSYSGDTQIVPLTVNVEGGADWSFNLRVRFKDCDTQDEMNAKRDATTLTVVKAAN